MNHPEVTIVYTQISKENSPPPVECKNHAANPIESLSTLKKEADQNSNKNCRFYSSWRKRSK